MREISYFVTLSAPRLPHLYSHLEPVIPTVDTVTIVFDKLSLALLGCYP